MTLYNGQVETIGNYWYMYIRQPIYGTNVAIREKILTDAIKRNKRIIVQCPHGEQIIDPKTWKKTAKKISKVFLIPDRPMILYQGNITYVEELKPKEAFLF